jgi:hypothetical protein
MGRAVSVLAAPPVEETVINNYYVLRDSIFNAPAFQNLRQSAARN